MVSGDWEIYIMLKLTDNTTGEKLSVGSHIIDDEGTVWYITGYGMHPIGGQFVELAKMDELAKIAEQFRADSYDLKVEYDYVVEVTVES
jgi:hypothetical protein